MAIVKTIITMVMRKIVIMIIKKTMMKIMVIKLLTKTVIIHQPSIDFRKPNLIYFTINPTESRASSMMTKTRNMKPWTSTVGKSGVNVLLNKNSWEMSPAK